jgi:hypothetical protein
MMRTLIHRAHHLSGVSGNRLEAFIRTIIGKSEQDLAQKVCSERISKVKTEALPLPGL